MYDDEKNLKQNAYEKAKEDWKKFMELCTRIVEIMNEPEPTEEELEKILLTNY